MMEIGSTIDRVLAALVVIALVVVAGSSLVFQVTASDVADRNETLDERNERLHERLNETQTDLAEARERLRERNRSVRTARRDVHIRRGPADHVDPV